MNFKRYIVWFFLTTLTLSSPSNAQSIVGFIEGVQGKVQVLTAEKVLSDAFEGHPLGANDIVFTSNKSSAEIFLKRSSFDLLEVSENQKWSYSDGLKAINAVETSSLISSGRHAATLTRSNDGYLWAKLPTFTAIAKEPFTLDWSGSELQMSAQVEILDGSGQKVVQRNVHNGVFQLTAKDALLKQGKTYQWRAKFPDNTKRIGELYVLTNKEFSEVRNHLMKIPKNDSNRIYKQVSIFIDAKLYRNALALVAQIKNDTTKNYWIEVIEEGMANGK
ncbi:hypothetical protein [Terasakiella pusilla]|uniref:hypothetical protein n=1 Tax=Terasakiella pusilla TaxID=64973 RepID=UPI003AA8F39C